MFLKTVKFPPNNHLWSGLSGALQIEVLLSPYYTCTVPMPLSPLPLVLGGNACASCLTSSVPSSPAALYVSTDQRSKWEKWAYQSGGGGTHSAASREKIQTMIRTWPSLGFLCHRVVQNKYSLGFVNARLKCCEKVLFGHKQNNMEEVIVRTLYNCFWRSWIKTIFCLSWGL